MSQCSKCTLSDIMFLKDNVISEKDLTFDDNNSCPVW